MRIARSAPLPKMHSRSRSASDLPRTIGMHAGGGGRAGHADRRPTNPTASPRDRPARPGPGFARPRRPRRANGSSRARGPTRQTGRRRTAPRADARPSGKPRAEMSVSKVSSAGGQAVEKLQHRAEARIQQRHLAGIRLRDAQQLVGIVIGREHSVGHVGRRRAAADRPARNTPGGTAAARPTSCPGRPDGTTTRMAPRRFEPVDDLDETAGEVRLVDFAGRFAAARAGRSRPARRNRPPSGCRATCGSSVSRAVVTPASRSRAASVGRDSAGARTQRVPPLPVRAVQSLQLRRIDQGLVEDHRLAGQPVQGRRFDPRVAVRAEVARVQPVDDQADGIHAAIVADGRNVRKDRIQWQQCSCLQAG